MQVYCDFCGKEFSKKLAACKTTKHNFCSRQCAGKFRRQPNVIVFENDYAKIIIESAKYGINYALIDLDDVSKVMGYNWCISRKKYVYCNALKADLQRIVLNYYGNLDIDHINRNPLDNRKDNLRICSHLENAQNQDARKKNITKIKNIHFRPKHQQYVIDLVYKGKRYYGGCYKTLEEAKKALTKLKQDLHIE